MSAQPPTRGPAGRYDGLDLVRAGAMLLGVVYHATFAYVPQMGRWYSVEDASTAPALGTLELMLHAFRMQVFFVLSGFFAHLVLEKRGPQAFLADRFRRLMVPFLVGAPLVVLADKALRSWSLARGTLNPAYAGADGWMLRPLHLWFLEYLFLFVAAAWVLVRIGLRAEAVVRVFKASLRVPEVLLALSALTFLGFEWFEEPTPAMSFIPQLASLVHFGPFFLFGWLVWSARDEAARLERTGWMVVPAVALAAWVFSREVRWQSSGHFLAALIAWSMVLGSVGLALQVKHRARPALFAVVESSYWVYLVHLPLVVAAQIALAGLPWSAWLKYALVVVSVTAAAFAMFRLFVRPSFLAKWLGVKAPAAGS